MVHIWKGFTRYCAYYHISLCNTCIQCVYIYNVYTVYIYIVYYSMCMTHDMYACTQHACMHGWVHAWRMHVCIYVAMGVDLNSVHTHPQTIWIFTFSSRKLCSAKIVQLFFKDAAEVRGLRHFVATGGPYLFDRIHLQGEKSIELFLGNFNLVGMMHVKFVGAKWVSAGSPRSCLPWNNNMNYN